MWFAQQTNFHIRWLVSNIVKNISFLLISDKFESILRGDAQTNYMLCFFTTVILFVPRLYNKDKMKEFYLIFEITNIKRRIHILKDINNKPYILYYVLVNFEQSSPTEFFDQNFYELKQHKAMVRVCLKCRRTEWRLFVITVMYKKPKEAA